MTPGREDLPSGKPNRNFLPECVARRIQLGPRSTRRRHTDFHGPPPTPVVRHDHCTRFHAMRSFWSCGGQLSRSLSATPAVRVITEDGHSLGRQLQSASYENLFAQADAEGRSKRASLVRPFGHTSSGVVCLGGATDTQRLGDSRGALELLDIGLAIPVVPGCASTPFSAPNPLGLQVVLKNRASVAQIPSQFRRSTWSACAEGT